MSINRFSPHLYVIPEDELAGEIANGFTLHPAVSNQVQVVEPARGWPRVLATFLEEYVPLLRSNANAHVVLLIDFDGEYPGRFEHFQSEIPRDVLSRVFVVGPRDEPEALRRVLARKCEDVGRALAQECDQGSVALWSHPELVHNEAERLRMVQVLKPFVLLRTG